MKWAIREAVDVYFKAKSLFKLGARTIRAGEPVLIFDSVKTSTLDVATATSYVTGGRGNNRILAYEGDKELTFQFEEALLSAEGLAILSGADLIPARNKNLPGAGADAQSVIAHRTKKVQVQVSNMIDVYSGTGSAPADGANAENAFPDDESLYPGGTAVSGKRYPPRGGIENVWLPEKPYVGQNADIYLMLLDSFGEMSGAPLQVNLRNESADIDGAAPTTLGLTAKSYVAKWKSGYKFVAFDRAGQPMARIADVSLGANPVLYADPTSAAENGIFDDKVAHYVDLANFLDTDPVTGGDDLVTTIETAAPEYKSNDNWLDVWGDINAYVRQISASSYGSGYKSVGKSFTVEADERGAYAYLLAPSGGVAQPRAFYENGAFVYKVNVPSVLYGDVVLVDYYLESRHDAVEVSILPDKFAPYMYVEGSSLIKRASDGLDLPVEFVIPKLKITTALSFTMQGTGDPSTFNFQGDAFPDYSKFNPTKKILANIQILGADDNYDEVAEEGIADPTSYRRYQYDQDQEGAYLWKDPSIASHSNLDYSDAYDYNEDNPNKSYKPDVGGPATKTPGLGAIDD